MSFSLDPVTSHKIDRMIDGLHDEFGGEFPRGRRTIRTVQSVIEELGLDPDEEFARPVTDEVLRGAASERSDCPKLFGTRIGGLGDPIGARLPEIRRVRADIKYRLRALPGSSACSVLLRHALASRRDRACRADARDAARGLRVTR